MKSSTRLCVIENGVGTSTSGLQDADGVAERPEACYFVRTLTHSELAESGPVSEEQKLAQCWDCYGGVLDRPMTPVPS